MENTNCQHKEMLERYCHVIGENTVICRVFSDGKINYECLKKPLCDRLGGCKNETYNFIPRAQ